MGGVFVLMFTLKGLAKPGAPKIQRMGGPGHDVIGRCQFLGIDFLRDCQVQCIEGPQWKMLQFLNQVKGRDEMMIIAWLDLKQAVLDIEPNLSRSREFAFRRDGVCATFAHDLI